MEPDEYERMYQMEETHWWFVGKRKLINSLLEPFVNSNSYLLDIGFGTGANLRLFSGHCRTFGIDVSSLAIKYSSMRGCEGIVLAGTESIPFKAESFDAVTMLDVLYHKMVSKDIFALKEVYRVIKRGGRLIITDSALEFLRGPHDNAMHGKRRYSKKILKELVQDAGFSIEKLTYTNFLLFPFIYSVRLVKKLTPGKCMCSDLKPTNQLVNCLLLIVQGFERFLLKMFSLPVGSSILCVAKK